MSGQQTIFSTDETKELRRLYRTLRHSLAEAVPYNDFFRVRTAISEAMAGCEMPRDRFGRHPLLHAMATTEELCHRSEEHTSELQSQR